MSDRLWCFFSIIFATFSEVFIQNYHQTRYIAESHGMKNVLITPAEGLFLKKQRKPAGSFIY